jgi:hypothetical protein
MDEMDVEAADPRLELREGVDPCLLGAAASQSRFMP